MFFFGGINLEHIPLLIMFDLLCCFYELGKTAPSLPHQVLKEWLLCSLYMPGSFGKPAATRAGTA